MLFNSYLFVFIFFSICLIGYYLIQRMGRPMWAKLWLLGMSLWFYGYFSIRGLALLLVGLAVNYQVLQVMFGERYAGGQAAKHKKAVFAGGIIWNLGLLGFFKYAGFFMAYMNETLLLSLPAVQIILPLGISFYTFSQISFLTDAYHREIDRVSFLDYCLYITYFPKMIEGPITTHGELLPQFAAIGSKKWDAEGVYKGLALFVMGLAKKVLLADTFGAAVDLGYESLAQLTSGDGLLLILCYTMQLYFDFSGYCDMAMGLSRMLGIELPVNFDSPYRAGNIIEFWKGWHITLSRFFTKYIYIPLGGNRKGLSRMYGNLLLVFLVSGLWHGTGLQFVVWGMMHGVLYVITRAVQLAGRERGKAPETNKLLRAGKTLLTFLYVNAAWVFFRADSVAEALSVFRKVGQLDFGLINRRLAGCFNLDEFWYIIKVLHLDQWQYGHYIIMVIFLLVTFILVFCADNAVKVAQRIKPKAVNTFLLAVLFVWSVLSFSQVSTFLYVNF